MPANLTPDYERAEQRYRAAATDDQKLEALREMYATIPKHKGTEKLQAEIKRKISHLRKGVAKRPSKGPDPFYVPKGGVGQVVLIGTSNVGKSALVGKLTHAPVKVAEYPFATAVPVPGMCQCQDVQIELVDTPPVTREHVPAGLMGTIRNSDVIAFVVDASEDPLEEAEAVSNLLNERGLVLRSVAVHDLDSGNVDEHAAIVVANKCDLAAPQTIETLSELYAGKLDVIAVSAMSGERLERLVKLLWELLSVVRVYTKEPGKPPERGKPFVLPEGSTVEDLAREIHRELPEKMKFARVWGDEKFAGQQMHRTDVLHDGDVVKIHH